MRCRLSSKSRCPSFRSAALRCAAPAVLALLAGCDGHLPPADDVAAAPPLGTSARALRTREGRAAQLAALAREVTESRATSAFDALPLTLATSAGSSEADSSEATSIEATSIDAGAASPPAAAAADAGAPPRAPVADAGVPPAEPAPPPGLPSDIVEQSALPIYGLEAGVRLEECELWDRLAQSRAVCFGEFHDVPAHHHAEARALDELAARARRRAAPFAVGYEMFQRPYQAPLSAFVAGELGEAEFLAQTEYATRWGYDFALYRPLLERTRDHRLPALALNMQREITRKVGRGGLESLSEEERALLPELVLDDEEHRAFIFGLFGVLPEHADELGLENIYVAQTLWDETMADTSARWLASAGHSARLLDFAGAAHCHRSAIPRRIERRTGKPALSVHAVFESELSDGTFTPDGFDVLVVLDD